MSERRFRVWQGGLSGRIYAAWMTRNFDGIWESAGDKHDVTEDVEAIIRERAKP